MTATDRNTQLLSPDEQHQFQQQWQRIQTSFVDDPGAATRSASELLAKVEQHINEAIARERATIDERWNGGVEPGTEILRTSLQGYRAQLERLLAIGIAQGWTAQHDNVVREPVGAPARKESFDD